MTTRMDRYFIELKHDEAADGGRLAKVMARRRAGEEFVTAMRTMLHQYDVEQEAPFIEVTMLGQVAVMCSPRVVQLLISAADLPIDTIRQGKYFTDTYLTDSHMAKAR